MNRAFLTLFGLVAFASVSRAQSSTDLNEGARVTHESDGTTTLGWWGRAGMSYFIQQSEDLISWNYLPVIEPGTDHLVEWSYTLSTDHLFLRLRYTDIPTDDPLSADFDGDGLSNFAEVHTVTDPFVNDAGLDFDADGLTNAEEYWLGTKLKEAADTGAAAAASVGLVVHTDLN